VCGSFFYVIVMRQFLYNVLVECFIKSAARGELLWPGLIISRHEMQLISPTQKELISLQFEPAGRRGLKTIFHGAYITQSGLLLYM
jgi:hypothetical protein